MSVEYVCTIVGRLLGQIVSTPFTVSFQILSISIVSISSFCLDTDTVEVKCNYLMQC